MANLAELQPVVSRRSFMVGAAGLTFAGASGATGAAAAATESGKAVVVSPWVTIATDVPSHHRSFPTSGRRHGSNRARSTERCGCAPAR